ncbi:putative purine permease 11 [Castilleja foliolosa]|uniref:Probable purine permease n=1 Tax=Castilleja foliolosa TaxID=1961234 RepID=A0ABD3B8G8_9LAMI
MSTTPQYHSAVNKLPFFTVCLDLPAWTSLFRKLYYIPIMTDDNQVPILDKVTYEHPLRKLKRFHWWILVLLNITFIIVGQAAAVLLGRLYYDKGGNSKWMSTLVQTAAFPLLLVPYFIFIRSPNESPSPAPPSFLLLSAIYFVIGALVAGDNMLYSTSLLYLSASTYSLICATQLAFISIFSFFINGKKFTVSIFISVVFLSLSAVLLSLNEDSDRPLGVSIRKYIIGILTAVTASALYSLIMSLMQQTFERILRKEMFIVVLEMQIYTSATATCVAIVGLFASGEWGTLRGEMGSFESGKVSYVMTLVWIATAWQVCSVGLIFVVSSLFSNVISTLSWRSHRLLRWWCSMIT